MTLAQNPAGIDTFFSMITYKRPSDSVCEEVFIEKFLHPHTDYEDQAGNLFKTILNEDGSEPTILFSCHTDTVHKTDGIQTIEISADGWVHPAVDATECLGADCTAGIWLMIEMIKAKVPGLYVFHRAEESGGIGSDYIAKKTPEVLKGIQAAIAFDRYGFSSVITHQFGQRCCSDMFADSMISILGETFEHDDGGSFTDTANYTDLIPECTNISVGYLNQHSTRERQHYQYLAVLRDILVEADWSKLVIFRRAGEIEYSDYKYVSGSGYHRLGWGWEDDIDQTSVQDMVVNYPREIAEFLEEMGYSVEDLREVLRYDRKSA